MCMHIQYMIYTVYMHSQRYCALHGTVQVPYGITRYGTVEFCVLRSTALYRYRAVEYYTYIHTSAPLIQVEPPGYFIHISITTPIARALKTIIAGAF
jgi:hypothetical protein